MLVGPNCVQFLSVTRAPLASTSTPMQKSGDAEIWAPVARLDIAGWVSMEAALVELARWMKRESNAANLDVNMLVSSRGEMKRR